jgi:hypothetical protein
MSKWKLQTSEALNLKYTTRFIDPALQKKLSCNKVIKLRPYVFQLYSTENKHKWFGAI